MSNGRIHYHFQYKRFLKEKEEVSITDSAIIVKRGNEEACIPLADIRSVAACGTDGIAVGYGITDAEVYRYVFRGVHSNQIIANRLLELVRKNKIGFVPTAIGYC